MKKPTPSTSTHHEPEPSKKDEISKPLPKDESKSVDDFADLWEDELENLQPPTLNRSNPSSYYGVSDSPASSSSSNPSVDPVVRRMAEPSSDEEVQISEIPELLSEFCCGDILPARVSDSNNPLKFWVHIRQEKYVQQINKMLTDMQ